MQFESLKLFCDIVRNKSFSLAAVENHVTQSAASQVVSQLEKRLGVLLINRSERPLIPTPKGQLYYEGCKELVERYMELEASVRNAPPSIPPSGGWARASWYGQCAQAMIAPSPRQHRRRPLSLPFRTIQSQGPPTALDSRSARRGVWLADHS